MSLYISAKAPLNGISVRLVYSYYNEPVLYAAENEEGVPFLVSFIDKEEDCEIWLYAQTTDEMLDSLDKKEIDLRTLILNASAYYQAAVVPGVRETEFIRMYALPNHYLPAAGEFIKSKQAL